MDMKKFFSGRFIVCLAVLMLLTLFIGSVSAGFVEQVSTKVSSVVCGFYLVFRNIAVGVAAVVMVMAGIKWTASENDPGARKAAKDAMIHAIVGLIIILIISAVLGMFSELGNMCIST